jgi:hypothetical protein
MGRSYSKETYKEKKILLATSQVVFFFFEYTQSLKLGKGLFNKNGFLYLPTHDIITLTIICWRVSNICFGRSSLNL